MAQAFSGICSTQCGNNCDQRIGESATRRWSKIIARMLECCRRAWTTLSRLSIKAATLMLIGTSRRHMVRNAIRLDNGTLQLPGRAHQRANGPSDDRWQSKYHEKIDNKCGQASESRYYITTPWLNPLSGCIHNGKSCINQKRCERKNDKQTDHGSDASG
jgi:hypothetical protein